MKTNPARIVKRICDILGALTGLVILMPLFIIIVIMIRIYMGSPVIFTQTRPGLKGRPFKMYKFRTMNDQRGPDGKLAPDEQRLTTLGKKLRSTSLDELPELINVLKGEMSLVGPRPLLVQYLSRYTPQQARRHEVRPGITGWAQVNGRNAISWEDKFYLDVWYIDNWSLGLDIKIILLTLLSLFKKEGINAEGSATMPEFLGSEVALGVDFSNRPAVVASLERTNSEAAVSCEDE